MFVADKVNSWVNIVRYLIPERALRIKRNGRAKKELYDLLVPYRADLDSIDPGPVPPPSIVMTTSIKFDAGRELKGHLRSFIPGGYQSAIQILQHLQANGCDISALNNVFELGCGGGRIIRAFRMMSDVTCVGSDVNAGAIQWCEANIPGVDFHVNQLSPPLSFAADSSFDLVMALSVFTHIPLDVQDAWINELYRVVKPGGFCYFTVTGKAHQNMFLTPDEQSHLVNHGTLTLTASDRSASFSTKQIDSWDVFQDSDHLHAAFGKRFRIAEHVESSDALDVLVLQKR